MITAIIYLYLILGVSSFFSISLFAAMSGEKMGPALSIQSFLLWPIMIPLYWPVLPIWLPLSALSVFLFLVGAVAS